MIVVLSELRDSELNAFKIMSKNAKEEEVRQFLAETRQLKEQGDKSNADAVLQVSANVNRGLFERIRGEIDMCEALRELMADDLKDAEEKGIEQGIMQGIEQGIDRRLVDQVCKKLRKGKDISEIADELEETEVSIAGIVDIAKKFAPGYDAKAVYEEYAKNDRG